LIIDSLTIKECKITVLVFLCGCENCSVTLREGRRLNVFARNMLRIIAGLKKEK
jgi:hypothetical protein